MIQLVLKLLLRLSKNCMVSIKIICIDWKLFGFDKPFFGMSKNYLVWFVETYLD